MATAMVEHCAMAERAAATDVYYGPCLGEFGHELAAVPLLRKRVRGYKRVTVCSRPARKALYDGICHEFIGHDIVCQGNCNRVATYETVDMGSVARWRPRSEADVWGQLKVHDLGPVAYREAGEFVKMGRVREQYRGAVVVHARNRAHVTQRNWPQRYWNQLARRLFGEGVKRIICVGTIEAALMVEGALDLRAAGLREQIDAIRSASFVVGVSSGPIHIAQFTGTPLFTYCGGPRHERDNTRHRYEQTWNVFNAPHHVFTQGNWQPSYEKVERRLLNFMAELDGMGRGPRA